MTATVPTYVFPDFPAVTMPRWRRVVHVVTRCRPAMRALRRAGLAPVFVAAVLFVIGLADEPVRGTVVDHRTVGDEWVLIIEAVDGSRVPMVVDADTYAWTEDGAAFDENDR